MLAVMFAGAPPVAAQESTANVEVRVWQRVDDGHRIYISARPEGGDWGTLGTIRLPLDDGYSSSGNYRYGDITVEGVEVRVWQEVSDARRIYISARPEGGDWSTLGTIPLPLDDGYSSSGNYRYGDITVAVPLPAPEPSLSASCTVEQRSASWDVEWFAVDSNRYAGRSLGRRQWDPTFSTDWGWGHVFGGRDDRLLLDATMSIVVPHAGWFWFEVGGDDGFRLYINSELVLEDWNDGSARRWGRFRWMQPGVHELRLMYYEWRGQAKLSFDTDQTLLNWFEAEGCDTDDRARLSAEPSAPIVFAGDVLPNADSGPIVVLLQGIDSSSSCGEVREARKILSDARRQYEREPSSRDSLNPGSMFMRRHTIVGKLRNSAPGDWESSVVGFSYSGAYVNCITSEVFPETSYPIGDPDIFPEYEKLNTCVGVRVAAGRLGDLLENIHTQNPDREIVILGHSLGGVVAAFYATDIAKPEVLDSISEIVTIDSPLLGDSRGNPLSNCPDSAQSWKDIRGESNVIPAISSIQNSGLVERFIHLNSTDIGDSLAGGREVRLECGGESAVAGTIVGGILGIVTGGWGLVFGPVLGGAYGAYGPGHGCGFYDPVALEEITEAVRQ